ncbi:MAG TPA: 50S ribosomal protein L35 [Dehalococcoidia bacterium]|nr:50S ribosomal protein L35 [Dehalococcoidia bacterium]
MPKLKTHKGAKKRFGVTGSGKFTRRKGGISHNRTRKSARALRDYDEMLVVHPTYQKRLQRLMPYAK